MGSGQEQQGDGGGGRGHVKRDALLRGQTGAITFDKAGAYNCICGLHPTMKGTIEVR